MNRNQKLTPVTTKSVRKQSIKTSKASDLSGKQPLPPITNTRHNNAKQTNGKDGDKGPLDSANKKTRNGTLQELTKPISMPLNEKNKKHAPKSKRQSFSGKEISSALRSKVDPLNPVGETKIVNQVGQVTGSGAEKKCRPSIAPALVKAISKFTLTATQAKKDMKHQTNGMEGDANGKAVHNTEDLTPIKCKKGDKLHNESNTLQNKMSSNLLTVTDTLERQPTPLFGYAPKLASRSMSVCTYEEEPKQRPGMRRRRSLSVYSEQVCMSRRWKTSSRAKSVCGDENMPCISEVDVKKKKCNKTKCDVTDQYAPIFSMQNIQETTNILETNEHGKTSYLDNLPTNNAVDLYQSSTFNSIPQNPPSSPAGDENDVKTLIFDPFKIQKVLPPIEPGKQQSTSYVEHSRDATPVITECNITERPESGEEANVDTNLDSSTDTMAKCKSNIGTNGCIYDQKKSLSFDNGIQNTLSYNETKPEFTERERQHSHAGNAGEELEVRSTGGELSRTSTNETFTKTAEGGNKAFKKLVGKVVSSGPFKRRLFRQKASKANIFNAVNLVFQPEMENWVEKKDIPLVTLSIAEGGGKTCMSSSNEILDSEDRMSCIKKDSNSLIVQCDMKYHPTTKPTLTVNKNQQYNSDNVLQSEHVNTNINIHVDTNSNNHTSSTTGIGNINNDLCSKADASDGKCPIKPRRSFKVLSKKVGMASRLLRRQNATYFDSDFISKLESGKQENITSDTVETDNRSSNSKTPPADLDSVHSTKGPEITDTNSPKCGSEQNDHKSLVK